MRPRGGFDRVNGFDSPDLAVGKQSDPFHAGVGKAWDQPVEICVPSLHIRVEDPTRKGWRQRRAVGGVGGVAESKASTPKREQEPRETAHQSSPMLRRVGPTAFT